MADPSEHSPPLKSQKVGSHRQRSHLQSLNRDGLDAIFPCQVTARPSSCPAPTRSALEHLAQPWNLWASQGLCENGETWEWGLTCRC